VVCVNAAVAIQTIDKSSYEDALKKAQESLISGKAFEKLNQLIELSK
jgi:anthranilate phosphoribosyltransferase